MMTMPIVCMVTFVFVSAGALLGVMSAVYARHPAIRNFPLPEPHLNGDKFWRRVIITAVVTPIFTYAVVILLADHLFTLAPEPWWKVLLQVVGILFVYDFFYYFMHRYPFHQWRTLMRVHAMHHQSHRPIPIHAMHLHPVENIAGIALLLFTVWIFGPVNVYAFGVCFLVFSFLNIFTHVGMDLKLSYLRMLSTKHDLHHKHMRAGNYATLSPLPDYLFGTLE